MNHSEQRKKLRRVLAGTECLLPASVFDALSARVAETVGYEVGLLSGTGAACTTLAAPDLSLLTLTELADQTRRIARASKLSLIVDADHGYGNALNAMRTVQELEHAGASALSIHDRVLPAAFAQDKQLLISIEEAVGKLRAAVAARSDPALIIVARTGALKTEGLESVIARAKAYTKTGADAFFAVLENLEQLDAIRSATDLPIIIGVAPDSLKCEDLAARGARLLYRPHPMDVIAAAVKALQDTYSHLYNDGAPAALKSKIASSEEMEALIHADAYKEWRSEYLR